MASSQIDDTFLFKYEGSLLIECAPDENNKTIPIAYVVAEVECEYSS